MQGNVGIDRVGIEALAQDQNSFLVLVSGLGQKTDVGGERYVPGHFLPYKLECVRGKPHVLAAAGDGVGFRGGIVLDRSRVKDRADVAMALKDAYGRSTLGDAEFAEEENHGEV